MTFTLRPAVREKIGLLFAVAGASGSGKTFSALVLARGIANGTGKIAVIDTEAGRALHYAPKPGAKADGVRTFDFLHLDFQPPFTPERYIEAIQACEAAGATVIVIDSASHEWSGEGGCSDIQMAEAERMAAKDGKSVDSMTAPAWKRPKLRHQRMMARLIQCRTHLIFCLRAQEKVKIVGGKVTPVGFMPICEKSFMFEMSGSVTLHPETPGRPRYDLPHKLNDELREIFDEQHRIDAVAGKRLRAWAETGEDRPALDKAAVGTRDLVERIQDAASLPALKLITGEDAVVKQRAWLAKNRPELAEQVDDAVAAALAVYAPDDDAARVWARRYAPEVMLGVYAPEEFDEPPTQPREVQIVVVDEPKVSRPVVQTDALLPIISPIDGAVNQVPGPKWLGAVQRALVLLDDAEKVRTWRQDMGPHLAAIAERDDSKATEADRMIADRLADLGEREPGEEG